MFDVMLRVPTPPPTSPSVAPASGDAPTWADQLEAWATLGGGVVALAAAVATIWLLIHQIGEARRAQQAAHRERVDAAADRELARQDRELAAAERRDAEMMQARTIVIEDMELYEERPAKYGYAPPGVRARVVNYSQGPVHDVWVEFVSEEEPPQRFALQVRRVLGPGAVLPFDQSLNDDRIQVKESGVMTPRAKLVVYFVDMYGRRWRIEEATQPVRVTEWRPLDY